MTDAHPYELLDEQTRAAILTQLTTACSLADLDEPQDSALTLLVILQDLMSEQKRQDAFPFEEIEEVVRRLAQEQPERVSSIFYARLEDGEPECILGHAYQELGVSVESLGKIGTARDLVRRFHPDATPQQAKWLRSVQRYQDRGETWSVAVEEADLRFRSNS